MLAQVVGAITCRMGFVGHQGVAVTDHACGRVKTGDGQGVARGRGHRLRETRDHATTDDADPAHVQARQAVRCRNAEGSALGQRRRIAGRTLGQVGFTEGQLAAFYRQAGQVHPIVHRWRNNPIIAVLFWHGRNALRDELRDTVETGGGEANDRFNPPGHLFQQDKGMPASRSASPARTCTATRSGSRGFSGLGRVGTGRNGFLQLFDIGQLRGTRCHHLGRTHVPSLIGQQLRRH
ncbi:hypothetical protein D3C85_1056780 [compost metagenome]